MALQSLDPCAVVLPHVHPRATEMIYVNFFLILSNKRLNILYFN